jgi:hypothetical protein
MDKETLNGLFDALLGTGSARPPEATEKWYVCISDRQGGFKRHMTPTLRQAEVTMRDWQLAGWAAWIQDENGNPLVIAKKSDEIV